MEKSEIEVRKDRLAAMREQGIEPFPTDPKRTKMIADVLLRFDELAQSGEESVVAGRVITSRQIGALSFVRLRDDSGEMQMVLRADELKDEYEKMTALLDVGDFLEVRGVAYVTRTGEKSVLAHGVRHLAKTIRPLPEKWHGLQDVEVRYRQRELDLIANPEVKNRFIVRSKLVSALRRFLDEHGFLEVETPIMQAIPGGASAKPFITHHNALDVDFYLRIAPELYLKRLMVGGFEKVYEIGRCFRNEGIDYSHNPEFTMMEMYWAYAEKDAYIAFLEDMLRYAIRAARGNGKVELEGQVVDFDAPWPKTTFCDAIKSACGIDVSSMTSADEVKAAAREKGLKIDFEGEVGLGAHLDALYKATARAEMVGPVWVFDYPLDLKPLARQHPDDPSKSASAQLVIMGAEIVNAYYHELNDAQDQRARFEAQQELREQGSEEAQWMDEDFVRALEVGMPPASGMGVGIDRLVAMITESPNLKEVILFPTLRPKDAGNV